MSKRQAIIEAMVAVLADLPGNIPVHIWKDAALLNEHDMPCMIVRDTKAESSLDGLDGGYRHRLTVELQYWDRGATAWSGVHAGLVAMLAAYMSDATLDGLVTHEELVGHEIGLEKNGAIISGGVAELALTYYTDSATI